MSSKKKEQTNVSDSFLAILDEDILDLFTNFTYRRIKENTFCGPPRPVYPLTKSCVSFSVCSVAKERLSAWGIILNRIGLLMTVLDIEH